MQKNFKKLVALTLAATTLLSGCNKQQQATEMPYKVVNGNQVYVGAKPTEDKPENYKLPTTLTSSQLQSLQIVSKDGLLANEAANKATIVGDTENELLAAVYDYVSNNIRVDTANLIPLTEGETTLITENLDNIISCLKGVDNGAMSDDFANYMLWEFARTQRTWDVATDEYGRPTAYNILGVDPATRKVFVDITFQTTNSNKFTIPVSKIIKGSATENAAKEARLNDYVAYLNAKMTYLDIKESTEVSSDATYDNEELFGTGATSGTKVNTALDKAKKQADDLLKKFVQTWGSGGVGSVESELASILLEQQELSLIDRVRNYINDSNTDRMDLDYAEAYKEILKDRNSAPLTDAQIVALSEKDKFATWEQFADYLKTKKKFTEAQLKAVALGGNAAISKKYFQTADIGMFTYSGIATQNLIAIPSDRPATMVFRFIFDFDYDLTSQTAVKTSSVYLSNYSLLANDKLDTMFTIEEDKRASIPILRPYLDRIIYSYQRCIEQENLVGLYKLFGSTDTKDDFTTDIVATTSRFKDWDKYYSDGTRFCYSKFDAYDYEIVGWSNNTILVEVNRSKKIRGKGTQMTFPTYQEKVLIELALEEDNVYIKSETLVSSKISGEPLSMIRDVTGIADQIAFKSTSFSSEAEKAVIQAIQNFSDFQLEYASDYVELGSAPKITSDDTKPGGITFSISKNDLELLKSSLLAGVSTSGGTNIAPTEKIVYLTGWNQKSGTYCVVNLRETHLIEGRNKAINFNTCIELYNRNGIWVVKSYVIANSNVGDKPLTDAGCLCHDYTEENKSSISRYKETPEEAKRPMGTGTKIDHNKVDNSLGNEGLGNNEKPDQQKPTTTTIQTTTTPAPEESKPNGSEASKPEEKPVTTTTATTTLEAPKPEEKPVTTTTATTTLEPPKSEETPKPEDNTSSVPVTTTTAEGGTDLPPSTDSLS